MRIGEERSLLTHWENASDVQRGCPALSFRSIGNSCGDESRQILHAANINEINSIQYVAQFRLEIMLCFRKAQKQTAETDILPSAVQFSC